MPACSQLTKELVNNGILMQQVVKCSEEVKKRHDEDYQMVREVVHSSASHRTLLSALSDEVQRLKRKQQERDTIIQQKHQLWLKVKALQEALREAKAKAEEREEECSARLAASQIEHDSQMQHKATTCAKHVEAASRTMSIELVEVR